jgi:hypothetical protein
VLPDDVLLSAAAEYLRLVTACPSVVVVEITGPGDKRFRVYGAPPSLAPTEPPDVPRRNGPPAPPDFPPGALWLSPAEAALLAAATGSWQGREALTELSGVARDGLATTHDVGAILRNLVDRGLLEGEVGKGFRLRPAG